MNTKLTATYDGNTLILDEPLDIPVNTKVTISIEVPGNDVFKYILSNAKKTGISDWSENHDHYLYGVKKRNEQNLH